MKFPILGLYIQLCFLKKYLILLFRSIYPCEDVVDVALFTEPEEIYLVKKNGDVVIYDANTKTETVKIANKYASKGANLGNMCEYQLFVNRKEQICVMQSASEVPIGRHINVYSYDQKKLYNIKTFNND